LALWLARYLTAAVHFKALQRVPLWVRLPAQQVAAVCWAVVLLGLDLLEPAQVLALRVVRLAREPQVVVQQRLAVQGPLALALEQREQVLLEVPQEAPLLPRRRLAYWVLAANT
jgi:hypothetical protein